jgi:methyl-accepting chemotaxis protein
MACWQITRARRRRRPDFAVVASEVKSGDTIGKISRIAATIATSVAQQGSATREIARNVQNVASGTQEAASSIVEVNRGASQTGSASSEVQNSAQTLSAESARLREELDRFMASIRAA